MLRKAVTRVAVIGADAAVVFCASVFEKAVGQIGMSAESTAGTKFHFEKVERGE